MTSLLIKHTVEDYESWKPMFDDHGSTREEHGERGYRLFRTTEDPNEIVILFDWDTAENAQSFLEDSDLREVMDEAGVMGEPEIHFLDEVETRMPDRPMA